MIKEAIRKPGIYFYILPTYTQAKKVIWEGRTNDGMSFLDFIPPELLVKKPNDSELKIELINPHNSNQPGSIIRLIGSENYDSIRGTNCICAVFSEYAYQDPRAWEVVRPILRANGGAAIFITTPNGDNHAAEMFNMAIEDLNWFADLLTIKDTGLITERELDEERRAGMTEEMIMQEYMCSTEIGTPGAYYADLLKEAQPRITQGLYNASQLVHTVWDIGFTDDTVCIFYQKDGQKINIIDVLDDRGKSVDHYLTELKMRPYRYGNHYLPHDAFNKSFQTGLTTYQYFKASGFIAKPVGKLQVQEGIQAVRKLFPRFFFDSEKCKTLLLALKNYQREYDYEKKLFKKEPLHDWTSHFADACRYLALGFEEDTTQFKQPAKSYGYKILK